MNVRLRMYEYCYSYLGIYERVYISNCTVQDPGLLCFKHNLLQNHCITTKQAQQERGISYSYMPE